MGADGSGVAALVRKTCAPLLATGSAAAIALVLLAARAAAQDAGGPSRGDASARSRAERVVPAEPVMLAERVVPAERAEPALVDLNQRLSKLAIDEGPYGFSVTVDTSAGERTLSAGQYLAAVRRAQLEQQSHGGLFVLFNITRRASLVWIAVGLLGQALFTYRIVLQWLSSEREKRSVIPVGFWWSSLAGGLMLLLYFVWRKDVVGIVGQSTGVFVYARNLVLIYRPRRSEARPTPRSVPAAEPEARREACPATSSPARSPTPTVRSTSAT